MVHVNGRVSPADDIEVINMNSLADLDTVKKLQRAEKWHEVVIKNLKMKLTFT
jgi:ribosome-binding ATPase YchF (GTP1/OBG family)